LVFEFKKWIAKAAALLLIIPVMDKRKPGVIVKNMLMLGWFVGTRNEMVRGDTNHGGV
jgi:hypothetical protein